MCPYLLIFSSISGKIRKETSPLLLWVTNNVVVVFLGDNFMAHRQ
jgi:hypothetical protein